MLNKMIVWFVFNCSVTFWLFADYVVEPIKSRDVVPKTILGGSTHAIGTHFLPELLSDITIGRHTIAATDAVFIYNLIIILQKETYKAGKITGAMRILKGQEILPDDNTLVQHNISDGDTVNIVIEPEKKINIQINFGLETFEHNVSNSISIKDLKQLLRTSDQVGFCEDDFGLRVESDGEAMKLDDERIPVDVYGIQDQAKLNVFRNFMMVGIVPQEIPVTKWHWRTKKAD